MGTHLDAVRPRVYLATHLDLDSPCMVAMSMYEYTALLYANCYAMRDCVRACTRRRRALKFGRLKKAPRKLIVWSDSWSENSALIKTKMEQRPCLARVGAELTKWS